MDKTNKQSNEWISEFNPNSIWDKLLVLAFSMNLFTVGLKFIIGGDPFWLWVQIIVLISNVCLIGYKIIKIWYNERQKERSEN